MRKIANYEFELRNDETTRRRNDHTTKRLNDAPRYNARMVFLKLGGSLITDKHRPYTPLPGRLAALAGALAAARRARPDLRVLVGHGSGSFGHWAAKQGGDIRHGVRQPEDWQHFVRVWHAAQRLNRLVVDALLEAGVPAVAFPPSAVALAEDGTLHRWDTAPLEAALAAGLVPVTYGDVVFDARRGGVIVSTEEIFAFLAPRLRPQRILIAGVEPGVWADFPQCTRIVPEITPANAPALAAALGGSAAADVTGGMASKVETMLALAAASPDVEVLIFDGRRGEDVQAALLGEPRGTRVVAQ